MKFLNSSLYKANLIVVLAGKDTVPPENPIFASVVTGPEAAGISLIDDPVMRIKHLSVPKLNLQIVWEGERLRIEDEQALEPKESLLVKKMSQAVKSLFPNHNPKIAGFGFNFELYYQFPDVIRMQDYFNSISSNTMSMGDGLKDFGWQWTMVSKNNKQLDGYFLKITAPLELAVHHNAHFVASELPGEKELQKIFEEAYLSTHRVVESLKF